MIERVLKLWIFLCAMVGVFTITASAADVVDSGNCGANGNNVIWTLDSEGLLTIEGTGKMKDYTYREDSNSYNSIYTNIPWYTKRSYVKTVDIRPGVTYIGQYAFCECSNLTDVSISDGVTEIGTSSFFGCSKLASIIIPNSVISISHRAFSSCTELSNITIPQSVTSIGDAAFYGCVGLSDIVIPQSITSIGNSVFYGCVGLTSIAIPQSVTSIGHSAFYGCTMLADVTISDNVVSIDDSAFRNCEYLTSITIPESVTHIGSAVFTGCKRLTRINVADENRNYSSLDCVLFNKDMTTLILYPCGKNGRYVIPDTVTSIENGAFSGCIYLTDITIHEGVISIGNSAFANCTSLTNVIIPETVTAIGSFVFYNCDSLTNVVIPRSVESYMFAECSNLISVTILSGATSIKFAAFEYCRNLNNITIPDSLVSVDGRAFYICGNLKDVYYSGQQWQWNSINIDSNENNYLTSANIHYNSPRPTPTNTPTPTPTNTPTPTPTPINTPTPIPTNTPTPTITPIPTLTDTPTPTLTNTPIPTPTNTPTPTAGPIPEITVTVTITPTITPTPTLRPILTPTPTPGENDSSVSEETSHYYRSGVSIGRGHYEGQPMDLIRLQLPTVGKNVFDLYLDPHGLISATNAVRYGRDIHLAKGKTLYFFSLASDGKRSMDNVSAELTVTNKSRLPVGVEVNVSVDRGRSRFTFVDSAGALHSGGTQSDGGAGSSAAGNSGAAMYLAIVSSGGEMAVTDSSGEIAVTDSGGEMAVVDSAGELVQAAKVTISGEQKAAVIASSGSKQYPDVTFQWARDVGNDTRKDFLTKAEDSTIAVTVRDTDRVEIAPASVEGYKASAKPDVISNTARERNVAVTYTTSDGEPTAAVYFLVAAGALDVYEGQDVETTLTLHSDGVLMYDGQASIRRTIAGASGAYVMGWDDEAGYNWEPVETTSAGAMRRWGYDPAAYTPVYDSFSFRLTGAINDSPAWDNQGGDITLNIIWDVFAVE